MATVALKSSLSSQFASSFQIKSVESNVESLERQWRIHKIALIVFVTLAALAVAASIALIFVAVPMLWITGPAAVTFAVSATQLKAPIVDDTQFKDVLEIKDRPDLLQRFGSCCKNIDLSLINPGIKLSTLKKWLLSASENEEFKQKVSGLLPIPQIDPTINSNVFNQWEYAFNLINTYSIKYHDAPDKSFLLRLVLHQTDFDNWQRLSTNVSPAKAIEPENIPVLISAVNRSKSFFLNKNIDLGSCINPEIIQACAYAGFEEITIGRSIPIFEETAQELVNMKSLKKLHFTSRFCTTEVNKLISRHFKTDYFNAYSTTTWERK